MSDCSWMILSKCKILFYSKKYSTSSFFEMYTSYAQHKNVYNSDKANVFSALLIIHGLYLELKILNHYLQFYRNY